MIRHPVVLALGLLTLLAWAPLPFGSVTPWATALLELAGFVVLALALLLAPASPLPRAVRNVALAIVLLAALGWAQSLDWPAALVQVLSSEHLRLGRESALMLELPPPGHVSLSLAPETSRRIALVWLLGAAALLTGALLGRSRRARRALLAVIAASALFQVAFGLRQLMKGGRILWGIVLPWRRDGLHGTFVNPNHAATYLLIVGATLFAMIWWRQRRYSSRQLLERGLRRLGPPTLLWAAVLAGLVLTGSRAGLVGALAGLAAQATVVALGGERRRVFLAGAATLALASSLVVLVGLRSGVNRFANPTEGGRFRLEAMADTVTLFTRFPATGVGLGGFRAAFPLVHEVIGQEGEWWHAHNDWLELAATTGVVGLAIAIFGIAALVRGLWRSWRKGERSEDRAAALAAIGACVAVSAQELLDFGMTMPANSVTLAVVCGAALAVPLAQKADRAVASGAVPESPGTSDREPPDAMERERSAAPTDDPEGSPTAR